MGVLRRGHTRLSLALAFLLLASAPSLPTPRLSGVSRRLQGWPGSWPPSCRSKCGWCSPCTAIHVPIRPGVSMPLEYYPEAWRCKCGSKLFMP